MESICDNIKMKLREEGFKLEYVAKQLGITQSSLSQRLDNGDQIKYQTILEISKVTNIPVIDFITYPFVYEKKSECVECVLKENIIKNLNEYISILKGNVIIIKSTPKLNTSSSTTIKNNDKFQKVDKNVLSVLYNQLPADKQKDARDFIKNKTGKGRGTVWSWTKGNSRIPIESIEYECIEYIKSLLL